MCFSIIFFLSFRKKKPASDIYVYTQKYLHHPAFPIIYGAQIQKDNHSTDLSLN